MTSQQALAPEQCWRLASDARAHLVSLNGQEQHLQAACGASVFTAEPVNGGTTVCLGCLAAVLATERDAPVVPNRTPRRSRRCLHTQHRWLVNRCRPTGAVR
jgi:hypothetical protein